MLPLVTPKVVNDYQNWECILNFNMVYMLTIFWRLSSSKWNRLSNEGLILLKSNDGSSFQEMLVHFCINKKFLALNYASSISIVKWFVIFNFIGINVFFLNKDLDHYILAIIKSKHVIFSIVKQSHYDYL